MVTGFDPSRFRAEHPKFCDAAKVRVPGLGAPPPTDGATPFDGSLSVLAGVAKDPNTIPGMLKQGPEAIGFYLSFRLSDRWGIYLRRPAVVALREEYHRIIMRDLKGYMEKPLAYQGTPIDSLVAQLEHGLVLDFLVAHLRFHCAVDLAAAQLEEGDGVARYIPYQERQWAEITNPPKDPRAIPNLEEALANFEGFRQYMNPTYTDAVAKVVEGALEERNASEWKAFFIGGRWGVEIANMLSRQPPGYRDVTKICNRRTSVGATNYVRVMYMPDPQVRDQKLKELSERIAGHAVEKSVLPEAAPDPPLYLL
jgi:hypothetical protein